MSPQLALRKIGTAIGMSLNPLDPWSNNPDIGADSSVYEAAMPAPEQQEVIADQDADFVITAFRPNREVRRLLDLKIAPGNKGLIRAHGGDPKLGDDEIQVALDSIAARKQQILYQRYDKII